MATLTLQERLDEARNAYHVLMTGRAAVQVRDSNGEQITYVAASASRLAAYIADLERQINGSDLGPLRVFM